MSAPSPEAVPLPGPQRPSTPTRRVNLYGAFTAVVITAFVVLIIVPMGQMVVRTFWVDGRLNLSGPFSVLFQPWAAPVFLNTIILVVVTTVLAVGIGAFFAWLNERTDANLGIMGLVLPLTPLLIPSVALAIGWVFIAAPRVGFLNGLMSHLGLPVSVNIYSWAGLIWVCVINGIPYVYLVVSAALQNFDPALEEASRVSGAGAWRTFRKVSLPAIKPALAASAFLVAISTFSIYSIPVIIATSAEIDLLAVRIVRLLTSTYPPQLGEAQVLSLVKLVIIIVLWNMHRRIAEKGQYMTAGGRATARSQLRLGRLCLPARGLMIVYMACVSVVPLIALIVVGLQSYWTPKIDLSTLTLDHFRRVLLEDRFTTAAFKNSLIISSLGATTAMAIAAVAAIYVSRRRGMLSSFIDGALKLPAVIPNVVIGVGFLVTFSGSPFNLSGTILLLFMAFLVMYIPPGSIAANAAVAQVGKDLQEASHVSGAGEGRTTWRVTMPLALPGFLAGWTMVFVHMMGDLSASALLAGIGNPVIGFAILEIWENGSFNALAAFSTAMCGVICIVVVLTTWMVRTLVRKDRR